MENLAAYTARGSSGLVTFSDGRLNVMSLAMLSALNSAFDRAEQEGLPVMLAAQGDVFSAGFDLKTFAHGSASEMHQMLKAGAELALRILTFPLPVLAVCRGPCYPMGAFLTMSSDFRLAAEGSYKIGMNEVAIGLTVPGFAIEIARQRLAPSYFNRTVVLGEMFEPNEALAAGFYDRLVPAAELDSVANEIAASLSEIDLAAHRATKLRARAPAIAAIRNAIDADITLEYAEMRVANRKATS